MRVSCIKVLWWKELRNTFRDKRTFWLTILMPLLLPLVLMLIVPLITAVFLGKSKPDLMTIAVQGKLGALEDELLGPANLLALTGVRPIKIEAVADAKLAVESKKYVTAIRMPNVLPSDFDQATIDLEVFSDSNKTRAKTADLYVRTAVDRFNKKLLAKKLAVLGVSDTGRDVLRIKTIDTADKKSSMSMVALSYILPMLMLAWAMAGAQPAAIDASAAERERGTFETLLVSAVTRGEVLLGKYLSVLSISITSALVGLLGFLMLFMVAKHLLTTKLGPVAEKVLDQLLGKVSFDAHMLLALSVSAIAISMAISAFALLPSLFAKTYKEAQMYLVPSLLSAMALAVPAFAADIFNIGTTVAWIPISGAVASMMRDLAGESDWWLTFLGFLSCSFFTVIALWVMQKLLNRERVLFRD
jgi:sodium transport system permease protein